jgi:hypothetical protein
MLFQLWVSKKWKCLIKVVEGVEECYQTVQIVLDVRAQISLFAANVV